MNLKEFRQKQSISCLLKETRKKHNLTQDDVAKLLSMSRSTYKSYEINRAEPSIGTLINLADFYHVSLDELVGREADTINLKYLSETEAYLIKKILKMNQFELDKTKAYVMGLTE